MNNKHIKYLNSIVRELEKNIRLSDSVIVSNIKKYIKNNKEEK